VRSQHLCAAASPGSAAAVKQDLGALLGYVPGGVTVKYFKPHDASLANSGALTAGARNLQSYSHKDGQVLYITVATIQVSDTRVAASNQFSFGFDELADRTVEFNDTSTHPTYPYNVDIEGVMRLGFADRELAQCVAEELRLLQLPMRKQQQDEALAAFRGVAEQYRAMPAKPQVSEEQRRFIVQANALTQKKEYAKAIALYGKVLEVNPFSYPAAHYNMALISAQQGRYSAAIVSMKKYLLLVPEAEDARSAQDKIYEWEALGGAQ
jgi:tetratricopeptide (TPR) repeat protein